MSQPVPNPAVQPPAPPRRRRGFGRWVRRILLWVVLIALVVLGVRYWPYIYNRLFNGNTVWVSQRFSEELKEQNRMQVFTATLTGEETVSVNAIIFGTIQKVQVPYSFDIGFFVDCGEAVCAAEGNTVVLYLPAPYADFYKLSVDRDQVKVSDFLMPLTSERYAAILKQIEQKLYDETAAKQEYLDSAWESAEKNMKLLFGSFLSNLQATEQGKDLTCSFKVVRGLPEPSPSPEGTDAAATAAP